MSKHSDLTIRLDFATVYRSAAHVRDVLFRLRNDFDLNQFEYCKKVRIAPTEIPHSHPEITLNTWLSDDLALLSSYLHEQMHWYVTWYSHACPAEWREIFLRLRHRYPRVPPGVADGAADEFSTYLHLVVNWLEIQAASEFFDRERVLEHVGGLPYYRWVYRTVIDDWQPLGALYAEQRLLPLRPATGMSPEDIRLAGLADEAPI
jgi:hypothetical protein